MKIALAVILCALAALASGRAQALPSPLPSPALATGIFVVRPDPRECPSPLCGGYWVSLANHARTRCSDGLLRPRCYAAGAVDAGTGRETQAPVNGLARGTLAARQFGGFGQLGVLDIAASWEPGGEDLAVGDFFRLRDTGVRCIRAPCFSFRAVRLNQQGPAVRISSVDLTSALDVPPVTQRRARAALESRDGLLAAGTLARTSDGGRVVRVTEVYFKAPPPRA